MNRRAGHGNDDSTPSVRPQSAEAAAAILAGSGLFDSAFYLAQATDKAARSDPLLHFCTTGWRQGLKPNAYFDPAWYLARNPDIDRAGVNPLVHYFEFGEAEGRPPSERFMPAWYWEKYGVASDESALAHFLSRRHTGRVAPVPVFDPSWYLERNPDVAASGADPFDHFYNFGETEGRNPAQDFELRFYQARYAARHLASP